MQGADTISGTTGVIGIIGDPVSHSLSPALHNAAFAAAGLDLVYVPLHVRADDLGAALAGLRALGLRGANVTIPHKSAAVALMDWLDDDARLAQAVNTVVVDGGRLRGHNTDVGGVRGALTDAVTEPLVGEEALVFGAGGAARAAALALARLGLRLTVVGRTAAHAERLAALVAAAVPGVTCRWLAEAQASAADVAGRRLLVNATPLGMEGASKVPAWMADNVSADQIVFDVVYTSGTTDLIARARGTRGEGDRRA